MGLESPTVLLHVSEAGGEADRSLWCDYCGAIGAADGNVSSDKQAQAGMVMAVVVWRVLVGSTVAFLGVAAMMSCFKPMGPHPTSKVASTAPGVKPHNELFSHKRKRKKTRTRIVKMNLSNEANLVLCENECRDNTMTQIFVSKTEREQWLRVT